MARMVRNPHVLGETTVLRAERAGHIDRWLVVTTDREADGPEMTQLIAEILGLLEHHPELAGCEIHSARHV